MRVLSTGEWGRSNTRDEGRGIGTGTSRDVFDTLIRIRVYSGSSQQLDSDEPTDIVSLSTHGE